MTPHWLALTMCLATAGGEECSLRLAPMPLESPGACQRVAAMIMRADPAYRLPLLCTRERPDVPEMPGTVSTERFAQSCGFRINSCRRKA